MATTNRKFAGVSRNMSSVAPLLLSLLAVCVPTGGSALLVRPARGPSPSGSGGSLSERLLSLWTGGSEVDGSEARSSAIAEDDRESFKKVLDFLANKATTSDTKKMPSAALQGLNALVSGSARTPRPIDLNRQPAAAAVLAYLDDLGIKDGECRLRTVCELLTEPQAGYGVFGELLNFVFGQEKLTKDVGQILNASSYKEFYDAAQNGRRMNDCSQIYTKCNNSYKEYIKLVNI